MLCATLDNVLRLISGVRVVRIKSIKKKIMSELEFSTKTGHVVKAVTKNSSKWEGKMIEVVKVETSKLPIFQHIFEAINFGSSHFKH